MTDADSEAQGPPERRTVEENRREGEETEGSGLDSDWICVGGGLLSFIQDSDGAGRRDRDAHSHFTRAELGAQAHWTRVRSKDCGFTQDKESQNKHAPINSYGRFPHSPCKINNH